MYDVGAMYDAVIVGGGHNGLTAAAYLSRAGAKVLLVERLDHVGGAAVSAEAFSGHPTRLSRYSYLVSMMPEQLIADLGLDVGLASRSVSSYSPVERKGKATGLLVERPEGAATAASFRALTGGDEEYAAWRDFYARVGELAEAVAPTVLERLPSEDQIRRLVSPQTWTDLVEQPIGASIERRFRDDVVRGVVATDALIGTFASLHDPSLVQNRCFLYHVIGNGTGEWRVPIGGMGAVTAALEKAAAGAELLTSAEVTSVEVGTDSAKVTWHDRSGPHVVDTRFVLSGCAPWVMDQLMGLEPTTKPEGAQLKVNFLLNRLPRLRSGIDPEIAFAGTLHLAESMSQLERAHRTAVGGKVPDPLPGEVYCHSLTDASVLGGEPAHTLTYFGLHTPASVLDGPQAKQTAVARAIASLDAILEDPILSVVASDAAGQPCIEAKTPSEIEKELAMPGGHIFHGDLDWPWAAAGQPLNTPARRWGVETAAPVVLRCGAGAQRGGAVSGIGGHNAAHAALEML